MELKTPLKRLLGIDAEILMTLVFRGWSSISGLIMILLVPIFLTPEQQGYFYTFATLLALQLFFELGLNQVIIQIASHDYAKLVAAKEQNFNPDIIHNQNRLKSLAKILNTWYRTVSLFFFFLVVLAGFYFFSSNAYLEPRYWLGPWVLLVLSTAINLFLSHKLTLLQGCGGIAQVAKMRTQQSVFGYVLMWLAFYLGFGLWALPILPVTSLIYTTYWLYKNYNSLGHFQPDDDYKESNALIVWREDILPLQWRFALSWISGYLLFQLFVPLTFVFHGTIEAGRLGITIALFTGILAVAMSWITAKNPAMAGHVALGHRQELNTLFKIIAIRSTSFVIISSLVIVLIITLGEKLDWNFIKRFASINVVISLAIASIVNSFIYSAAVYMRAHKKEPLVWVSASSGVLNAIFAYVAIQYSLFLMMLCYALITTLIALPWTMVHFVKYYRLVEK